VEIFRNPSIFEKKSVFGFATFEEPVLFLPKNADFLKPKTGQIQFYLES
jgi:hypothetical protein